MLWVLAGALLKHSKHCTHLQTSAYSSVRHKEHLMRSFHMDMSYNFTSFVYAVSTTSLELPWIRLSIFAANTANLRKKLRLAVPSQTLT